MATILLLLVLQTQVTGSQRLDKVPAGVVLDSTRTGVIPAGSVFGVVRDTAGRPIGTYPFVVVTIGGHRLGARVDSIGRYRLDSVPTGTLRVTARCIGFYGVSVDTAMKAGQRLRLDFALRPDTIKLAPVGFYNESGKR